ncbi:MAG: DNA polymerase, partial [Bacteroidetes bacterium]|nr:DNA polymerase [Bacteroidota bacterium]
KEHDNEKALRYAKTVIDDLRNKKIPINKVIIHTQLQKEIEDYDARGPHVAVAQMLRNKGINVGPGSMIKFVVTQGNDIIRNRAKLPDEIKKEDYDADYYINHQVVPAIERIFEVFGYKKEELMETKEQTKLEGFF